ncbi:pyridoxamine 5'-phosphate oxidase family protein [Neolewinella persica]|uniref:pyridoxamine 5'-phosphate oxidase family protein n=1 Tax=Neolewinella persica TaxID=70998 RepID=UPI0003805CC2|nr:pyridoxamine 5'-phosphate oxidase family protein [Neolewinella persica]
MAFRPIHQTRTTRQEDETMHLTKDIKKYINQSILCWLATTSADGIPNVSPKEIFNHYGTEEIIIANIASPQTVRNIRQNDDVCVSFIDILVQKGYQIKGKAVILKNSDTGFSEREKVLVDMTGGKYPFSTITNITIRQVKSIIAPKYLLYPETTEAQQIESAKAAYGLL